MRIGRKNDNNKCYAMKMLVIKNPKNDNNSGEEVK